MTKEIKASEILRKAAKLVEDGVITGGCSAIWLASNGHNHLLARRYFYDVFGGGKRSGYWWPCERCHGPRIIGLCLAAAIAESEGN